MTVSEYREASWARRLAYRLYRNPVVILCDGYLGQMTGRVKLPEFFVKPGLPEWGVYGDEMHRRNLNTSIILIEPDLEQHNLHLNRKYQRMIDAERGRSCSRPPGLAGAPDLFGAGLWGVRA